MTKKGAKLRTGEYNIKIVGGSDLRYELSQDVFEVKRFGTTVLTVTKVEPPPITPVVKQPELAVSPFDEQRARRLQEEWATWIKTETETKNSLGMTMKLIPPGEFLMGTEKGELETFIAEVKDKVSKDSLALYRSESPQHQVRLTKAYRMSAHEVTRGQFREFIKATGYRTEAERDGKGGSGFDETQTYQESEEFLWNTDLGFTQTDDYPVVNVSWNDANAFCDWLSQKEGRTYRLPTEAEWESASRAGTTGRWFFGDVSALEEYAWIQQNSPSGTQPVGTKKPNPFGLSDMCGNVHEWCLDWYLPYSEKEVTNPLAQSFYSVYQVLRGESWQGPEIYSHSAYRRKNTSWTRSYHIGFRVVAEIGPRKEPPKLVIPFDGRMAQQTWANYRGVPVHIQNKTGISMVFIPRGQFKPREDDSRKAVDWPAHTVTIPHDLYVSNTEVTYGMYQQFLKETGYQTDLERHPELGRDGYEREGSQLVRREEVVYSVHNIGVVQTERSQSVEDFQTEQTDRHPVCNITVRDAREFCKWLSQKEGRTYRLPTEMEWEWFARAGTDTLYFFGNDPKKLPQFCNGADNDYRKALNNPVKKGIPDQSDGFALTAPVGQYQRSPWGLFDIYGNVGEWCDDVYDGSGKYQGHDAVKYRSAAVRGGDYLSLAPTEHRSGDPAFWGEKYGGRTYIGFRVVMEMDSNSDSNTP